MKIRNKLFIVIMAVAAINLFFFASIAFLNIKESLSSSLSHDLDHVADAEKQEIEVFFEGIKGDLLTAQGYYNFKKNLPTVSRLIKNQSSADYIEAKKELDGQMQVLQKVRNFKNVILLNTEGEAVYFSTPNPEEYQNITQNYMPDVFKEGKKDIYLSDPLRGAKMGAGHSYFMLAAAPVYDADGSLIGEVVFDISLDPLFISIQKVVTFGETGEIVIGKKIDDQEILILNPLRHDPNAALNRKVIIGSAFGIGLQRAIGEESGYGVITDYRGVESLASWHKVPSMGWGLVAKIDTREAFATISQLRNILALLIFIETIILIFFIFFVSKSISDPIVKLNEEMEIIAKGNLSYKVAIQTDDEVGQLSRTFDKMIEQLKEIQFRYAELIESTPLCIKVFDSSGKLIFINKGGRDEHFIKDGTDVGSWDWLGTIEEPYRKEAKDKLEGALKGEGSVIEFKHTPKGSKHEWCSGVLNPIKGEDGKVKNVLFYSTDITALRHIAMDLEQKIKERTFQIETEREKFATLVSQLPVGVVLVDAADENVAELNKKTEEFLNGDANTIIKKGPFAKVIKFTKEDGSPYPEKELPMSTVLRKGVPATKEDLCLKRPNGTVINFRAMAVPVKNALGKIIYGIGVLEDITEEKKIEKMRMDFLSLASHQLRTPLSGTKWLIETLQMEKFGALNPKQKQYLVELDRVNERMIRLVLDMLNALRFESGVMELKEEKAPISSILDSVLSLMELAIKKKNITIQNLLKDKGKIIIVMDLSLVKSVLEALLSNAVEYSSSGQSIIIDAREDGDDIVFSIRDFGIGIPESEKGKVTERFYRASNAKAARPDGTGLGLYVASMLTEKMGGKITFDSKEREGSTFYLRIPKKINKKS